MGTQLRPMPRKAEQALQIRRQAHLGGVLWFLGALPLERNISLMRTLETPEGSRNWSISKVEIPEIEDVWLVLGFTGIGSAYWRNGSRSV